MEILGTRIVRTILKRKDKIGENIPNFKTYYKAIMVKNGLGQISEAELRFSRPHYSWSTDFSQGHQKKTQQERTVFSTNDAGTTGYPPVKELG